MTVNQPGYDRRQAVVGDIIKQFGLKSKSIEPLAYFEKAPFHFNNFIYKVDLESPALPSSLPGNQHGTAAPPPSGIASLIVRLSNLRAEGLNNTNRVANEVACSLLARQALEKVGLGHIVPVTYAWAAPKLVDVIDEGNFGWVVSEHKEGQDLDVQLPSLSQDDREDVLDQIAKIVSALQRVPIPAAADKFGGLTFDAQGSIVSAQMAIIKGGPFANYADVWTARLQDQLREAEGAPALNGWRDQQGLNERIRSFIKTETVSRALDGVSLGQRSFVHGDLTTNNMLYDGTSKKITGLLDYDWSVITHPAEEFCSGFRDIGGCVMDSHLVLVDSIVSNDFGAHPGGGSMTEKEDVARWEAGKAWSATAARNGVALPCDIAGIKSIKAMHDFSSALCPFALSCEPMLKRFSEEQRTEKKKAAIAAIMQFLDEHSI